MRSFDTGFRKGEAATGHKKAGVASAERPDVTAVVEEVQLQCFKNKIENKPHADTIQRIAALSDLLKLEKRKGRKAAAEKYEPIKGYFPGSDFPLAVVQIDHTPMDVEAAQEPWFNFTSGNGF